MRALFALAIAVAGATIAPPAFAFRPDSALPEFNGATLGLAWGVPFVGLLFSIALCPLAAPKVWHQHFGKIATGWVIALLIPFALRFGVESALHHAWHAVVLEYVPFIVVLFALYTVSGGIAVRGGVPATPGGTTAVLAAGTLLASVMGTTGAAMVLIRPLLAAIETRRHEVHAVIFFIILVGNIGGALSPLGDPPLFIGFLKGVDFFWPTRFLALPTVCLSVFLLVLFYVLDSILARREPRAAPAVRLDIEGKTNLLLLACVVGAVLLSGLWDPDRSVDIFGAPVELQNLVRDVLLISVGGVSLLITPRAVRTRNAFSWGPLAEVAKLFAAIFVTIVPVIAMLQAGRDGPLHAVIDVVIDPASGTPRESVVFWTTGLLSAFLDNAPTYLVFFNLAGGDPVRLMRELQTALAAISAGAVYCGALTYVGNAPNFMIKAIAEERGIAMPSFISYLLWSAVILALPLLVVARWLL